MRIHGIIFILTVLWASAAIATDCTDYGTTPTWAGTFEPDFGVTAVTSNDAYAYTVSDHLAVVDISDPEQPDLLGSLDLGLWLDGIAVVDGRAYLTVEHGSLLTIVDVTDPTAPELLGQAGTNHNIIALDVEGDHAFAIGGFAMDYGYFQVIDVSDPSDFQVIAEIETMCAETPGSVEARGDLVYFTNRYEGLGVVDVTEPDAPVLTWTDLDGYTTALDIEGSTAYVGGYELIDEGLLHVVNIQNPSNPVVVSTVEMPSVVRDVTVRGEFVYCGINEGFAVVSIADPSTPEYLGHVWQGMTFTVDNASDCICSASTLGRMRTFYPQCTTSSTELPAPGMALLRVAPNPFNPATMATFSIDRPREVTVSIHDARGSLVRQLVSGLFEAGTHEVTWNGLDANGRQAASGTYLFRIAGDGESSVQAVSLVK